VPKSKQQATLPPSVTSFRINLIALLCFLLGVYLVNQADFFVSLAS
jgi:hypothetical protein